MNAYIWGNALPWATFVISIGLLFISLRKKWPVEPASTDQPDEPTKDISPLERTPLKERIKKFVLKYRWELILGGTVGGILLFAMIFAPPRLNGNIAIHPNSPGRPFYSLHWIRAFLNLYYETIWVWSGAVTSILCLALLMWSFLKRSGFGVQFVVLCTSMNLAAIGQWLLSDDAYRTNGKILYFFAFIGFGLWAWVTHKRLIQDLERKPGSRTVEVLLILGLLLLTSFTRLYALRTIPYGIEGDEAKWTSEAVNLGIRGIPSSLGEYHRDALPVSYYIQIPLHRLLGPSLFAARLTLVILSIMGTLLFYWLLRHITAMPVAAIATFLLSISIFDISASRLANVESFVKIWPILGLALLALAVRRRVWPVYGLSGLALALGMLTYDTVWPLFVVIVIIALIELARQRENKLASMSSIAALITPTLLALPVLIPYLASRWSYYEFERKGLNHETGSTLAEYFGNVIRTWFVSLQHDFLYNRSGPLLNALLLPFLAFGLVIALSLIRKKISYWTLLWVGLFIFPIPILANSPMGRVYYPALPAVYILVALGIFFFWKEINRFLGPNLKPILLAVTLVPLIWLPLANLFIYFNEVYDANDRLMRRELGEIAAQAADQESLILLPAKPGTDTPINNEYQMLELYMMQKITSSQIAKAYLYVAPEELLSSIERETANYQKIEVIFDKIKTSTLNETLKLCFPQGTLSEGEYFNRFSLDTSESLLTKCNFAALKIEFEDENKLKWALSDGTTERLDMTCEVRQDGYEWLEMEDAFMENGWQTEIEFAPGWGGSGFAMDTYQSGPLLLPIYPKRLQSSYIWVRYYKRAVDESSAHLNIAKIPYLFADVQRDGLDSWRWERIGPVTIDIDNQVTIDHIFEGNPQDFISIFIDSLVITLDANFTPDTNIWKPIAAKTFSLEKPQSSGKVSLELPPDTYRCNLIVASELPVVDTLGNTFRYLTSNPVDFEIR